MSNICDYHDSGHMGVLWNFPQPFWLGRCSYCHKVFRRFGYYDWRPFEEPDQEQDTGV